MAYYRSYESSYETQAKWNMDDEVLKIVRDIKMSFLTNIKSWDLDNSYFDLVLFYAEIKAKFKDKEKVIFDKFFSDLEKSRDKFLKANNTDKRKLSSGLYAQILNVYSELNTLCKAHGLWFRESLDDDRGL